MRTMNTRKKNRNCRAVKKRGEMQMRVEYKFDEDKIRQLGYTRGRIYNTLNKAYKERDFICSRSDDVLAFDSTDHKEDLSTVLLMQVKLANSDWFLETATSYLFYIDENDIEPEDFLVNIGKLRDKPRKA